MQILVLLVSAICDQQDCGPYPKVFAPMAIRANYHCDEQAQRADHKRAIFPMPPMQPQPWTQTLPQVRRLLDPVYSLHPLDRLRDAFF